MTDVKVTQAVLIEGTMYIKQPDGSLRPAGNKTDWTRLKSMSESVIEANARTDADNLPLSDDDWTKAIAVPSKQYIHIGLDEDVLGWFKHQGRGYQTRINAVLRRYVDAHRKAS